jgi:murein DD-endopeptidase MepM/ murein hydrolase activator NlpD
VRGPHFDEGSLGILPHIPQLKKKPLERLKSKRYRMHGFLLSVAALATWQGQSINTTSYDSLLYTAIVDNEVSEGPLDPLAYAQAEGGVGGERVSAIEGNVGVDIITFDDPEVEFAAALGGNAAIGPLAPLIDEETSTTPTQPAAKKPHIYTVESGDTLGTIAEKFDLDIETIRSANGISTSDTIRPGDHLTILPARGVLHTVTSGDTISAIAKEYQVDVSEIVEFNGLSDESKLSIGQKLVIPGGKVAPRQYIAQQPPQDTPSDEPVEKPAPAPSMGEGWLWPTTSRHLSQYFRFGHTGIDIDNRARPPIYASQAGTVEFAGWLGGYGKLVILNHGDGLSTYYGHLENIFVASGEKVAKGDTLGKMGSTGRSTGPHLHFEVRRHSRPINPLGLF